MLQSATYKSESSMHIVTSLDFINLPVAAIVCVNLLDLVFMQWDAHRINSYQVAVFTLLDLYYQTIINEVSNTFYQYTEIYSKTLLLFNSHQILKD